ncbi:thioredoxin domain-containing protein [Rhodococcus erythropolis]|uniref:DsbA family protein n=1 Tax=Rhodococcus erythropolis TaxID=1833 RepID=UPI00294A1BE4|nr:thioredoxin domain-containing protein [Rhodococcus erythropolis]MDV6278248.1 thioredoxin domain-containing protein [Rhodococcus erythropolis]
MSRNSTPSGFIAAHDRRERRRTLAIRAGVTALVVGLVLAISVAIFLERSHKETAAPTAVPSAFTADGALTFGNPDAPVTVSVTEDFQCPACRQFETTTGPVLTELMNSGQINVENHPIAFLDRASSTKYSTRAANAAACVAQIDRDRWPAWKTAMFDNQPEEGGSGLTDEQIIDIAADVGISSPDLQSCITDQRYVEWVTATTDTAMNTIPGTPYVTVNGAPVTDISPDGLRAAITAAQ